MPNRPSGGKYNTNTSTWTLEYSPDETIDFLDAMFDATTNGMPLGKAQKDKEWPACLACAIVERKRQYRGMDRSDICEECFGRYCWNGADTFNHAKEGVKHPGKVMSSATRSTGAGMLLLAVTSSILGLSIQFSIL